MTSLNIFYTANKLEYKKQNRTMEHLNKYLEVALAIHAACSAICALTPTPKDDRIVRKIYRLIEIGGLVIGRAKQR